MVFHGKIRQATNFLRHQAPLFKRGKIWHVWVDGRQVRKSTGSATIQDAKRLRDRILGRKARGEFAQTAADNVICGELLNDRLKHARTNLKPSTEKIFKWSIEANIRPYF